jgi:hypothetical protein
MLYPARLRVELREFPLRYRPGFPRMIEENGPGTGGALIECQNVLLG